MKLNKTLILDVVYPIGSIYISVSSTNPSTLFGGTWEQLKDRFLLGAGDTYSNGATGGSASHSHTLVNSVACINFGSSEVQWRKSDTAKNTDMKAGISWSYGPQSTWDSKTTVSVVGETNDVSNLPPYLVCYMWKRTA